MPLMRTIARLASSPQGRRMFSQAKAYASSPQGREKVDQVRRQLAQRRRRPGSRPGPR